MIVPISQVDKKLIGAFDCGIKELNTFFTRYAFQNDKKNVGKTFVCLDDEKVIGFYTLSNAQIGYEDLSEDLRHSLPRYPIPCIRIARLAVDSYYKEKGYGKALLRDALEKIVVVSELTGIYFILVDAKDTSASFYEHYGFIKLDSDSLSYILPVKTVQKALRNKDAI